MSSLRIAGGLALALLVPATAAAQDVAALQHRLAQLEALKRTTLAAAVRAESASRELLDTVAVGSLRVISWPADRALVAPAAAVAWSRLDTLYGDAAAALASEPLLFALQTHPINENRPALARVPRMIGPENATMADVAFALVRAASMRLGEHSDSALTHWLGLQLLVDAPVGTMQTRAYVELVTAPSFAAHRCFAGDLGACRAALGLLPPEVDRAWAWYDAGERRALVRQTIGNSPPMGLRPAIDACVLSGSDSACLDVLRAVSVEPPLSNEARQALTRLALGSDRTAFSRLTASAGQPLPARLAAAARQPIDSLIARWRAQVMAARPRPVTFAATIGWTAVGWTLIFGFLALRSTRWR